MTEKTNVSPVIFLNFNRPEKTREALSRIRTVRPRQIFVFADGPRSGNTKDQEDCAEVRKILTTEIDWESTVYKLFPSGNLGCGLGVSTAISKAFEIFESAIIIEDDVICNESFFIFCSELLTRYSKEERVGAINGTNFQNGVSVGDGDFYFSNYFHCWGWATWRRVWEN